MVIKRLIPLAVVVLALVVSVGFAASNTITPDMPPKVDVADSIIGSWVLNPEKSDDPREEMRERQQRDGGGGGRQRGGGGGRPSGGRTSGGDGNMSRQERERIQASMRDAMRVAPRILISRTDSTVTLQTPQGNQVLFTDNRKVTVPVAADLDSEVKCMWDKD